MLKGIFSIFVFQLIGEAFQKYFSLSVPGPVIGLIFLLAFLLITKKCNSTNFNIFRNTITVTAETIVSHLSLLFIPIGVGVILHVKHLEQNLLEVMAIIVVGTVTTLGVTAFVMEKLQNIRDKHEK